MVVWTIIIPVWHIVTVDFSVFLCGLDSLTEDYLRLELLRRNYWSFARTRTNFCATRSIVDLVCRCRWESLLFWAVWMGIGAMRLEVVWWWHRFLELLVDNGRGLTSVLWVTFGDQAVQEIQVPLFLDDLFEVYDFLMVPCVALYRVSLIPCWAFSLYQSTSALRLDSTAAFVCRNWIFLDQSSHVISIVEATLTTTKRSSRCRMKDCHCFFIRHSRTWLFKDWQSLL